MPFLPRLACRSSSSKFPCPSRTIPKWLCRSIVVWGLGHELFEDGRRLGEERRCVGEAIELEEIIAQVVLGDGDVVSILEGGRRAVSEALEDHQSGAQAFLRFRPTNFALHLAQVVEHAGLHAQPLRGRGCPSLTSSTGQGLLIQGLGLFGSLGSGQDRAEVPDAYGLPDAIVGIVGMIRDELLIDSQRSSVGLLDPGRVEDLEAREPGRPDCPPGSRDTAACRETP